MNSDVFNFIWEAGLAAPLLVFIIPFTELFQGGLLGAFGGFLP